MRGGQPMNKLARESMFRNRSERLIDRVLMRVEHKEVEELKQKLADIEKRRGKQTLKRVKLAEQ
jgi:hypothetical protein